MLGQTNKYIKRGRLQRKLRLAMTDAERKLWSALRAEQMHGYKFRRQHPFADFIVDFVSLDARLVIEVDGGQHGEAVERDARRSGALEAAGFRVLRFWNNEVINEFDAVIQRIWDELEGTPSPPQPSP